MGHQDELAHTKLTNSAAALKVIVPSFPLFQDALVTVIVKALL